MQIDALRAEVDLLEQQLQDRVASRTALPQLQEKYQANMVAWDAKQHAIANLLRCTRCRHVTYLPTPMCSSGHISCLECIKMQFQDVAPLTDATIVMCTVCDTKSPISTLKERPCSLYQLSCMPTDSKCEYCNTKIFGVRMPFHILCCPRRPVQCRRCVPASTFPASEWKVHEELHTNLPFCALSVTAMIASINSVRASTDPSNMITIRSMFRLHQALQEALR